MDSSKICFLSPNCGIVTLIFSPTFNSKGTIISLDKRLNLSRSSTIASSNNSWSVSSNFFFISMVLERIMEPCEICKKLTKAALSSEIIENTSTLVILGFIMVDLDW